MYCIRLWLKLKLRGSTLGQGTMNLAMAVFVEVPNVREALRSAPV